MQAEMPDDDLIAVTMTKNEATLLRRWIDDHQTTFDTEGDRIADDLNDALFDLTYTPRTE
jgi:hypothetical protein